MLHHLLLVYAFRVKLSISRNFFCQTGTLKGHALSLTSFMHDFKHGVLKMLDLQTNHGKKRISEQAAFSNIFIS